jgi:hypothetical protein
LSCKGIGGLEVKVSKVVQGVDRVVRVFERGKAWVLTAVFAIVAVGAAAHFLRGQTVAAWVPVVLGAALLALAIAAFFVGRRSYRRLRPEAAERAVDELEVARTYLRQTGDFMAELRSSLTLPTVEAKLEGLQHVRDLVFTAIGQGVNTGPGEFIRCALFEPIDEAGETKLRTRHYHGHTSRVEGLRLHMGSVAGRAYMERRLIYIPDAATNPMLESTIGGSHPVETLLCLPAYGFLTASEAGPVGVFSVTSNKPSAFSLTDRRFISACADIIGLIAFFVRAYEAVRAASLPAPELRPGDD